MTKEFVTEYLDEKIAMNSNFIRCTYYEFLIERKRMMSEKYDFMGLAKIRLENLGYSVYFENDRYEYKGEIKVVEVNELMIAIKNGVEN